jgi:hypothetical protein
MNISVKLLPEINEKDYHNTQVESSKVLCIGVVASIKNCNNHQRTLKEFEQLGLIDYTLDKSQFSRRIVRLDCNIPFLVQQIAIYTESQLNNFPLKQIEKDTYVVDTKPIPICQNIRIHKCHLTQNHKSKEKVMSQKTGKIRKKVDEDYRGFCASKKEYYYGFKLNLLKNCLGFPREITQSIQLTHQI